MTKEQKKIECCDRYLDQMKRTKDCDEIDLDFFSLPLKVGVDLGTSNIVITVVDQENRPVAYELEGATVVKDGIVVQYMEAVKILEKLKTRLEKRLNMPLEEAATAIPPGIISGNTKVICNVVEGAGFRVTKVVDEPVAAAIMLGIEDGVVVDIGGGTTGVSVITDGQVEYSMDEATGGTHMTLVVAGAMGLEFSEAEAFKKEKENYRMVFPMLQPVIEKMAQITKNFMGEKKLPVYLAGGTSCLEGIETVFRKYLAIDTFKPQDPLLITPIGIAMSIPSEKEAVL